MSIELKNDNELVEMWINGSERAYSELFHRYFEKLYYYTLKVLTEHKDAEEIVLDVMLNVWKKKYLLNTAMPISAYLFRSVKNKIIDHLRQRLTEVIPIEGYCNQLCSGQQADHRILYKELEGKYMFSLGKLPKQKLLIFEMSRNEGLTYNEIAEKLNLSKNTVENHMVGALKILKQSMLSDY